MILDFNKPEKIMTNKERLEKYSSDSEVPGTYVPNMSKDDMYKWKAKYVKGIDERVEIRKTIKGVQLVCIVYKDEERSEKEEFYKGYVVDKLIHKQIHISANGKLLMTAKEFNEFIQAIKEAQEYLQNKNIKNLDVYKKTLDYLENIPADLLLNINSFKFDKDIEIVKKHINKNNYLYAIKRGNECLSKYDKTFYIEPILNSSKDYDFYKEFRFESLIEAYKFCINNIK